MCRKDLALAHVFIKSPAPDATLPKTVAAARKRLLLKEKEEKTPESASAGPVFPHDSVVERRGVTPPPRRWLKDRTPHGSFAGSCQSRVCSGLAGSSHSHAARERGRDFTVASREENRGEEGGAEPELLRTTHDAVTRGTRGRWGVTPHLRGLGRRAVGPVPSRRVPSDRVRCRVPCTLGRRPSPPGPPSSFCPCRGLDPRRKAGAPPPVRPRGWRRGASDPR